MGAALLVIGLAASSAPACAQPGRPDAQLANLMQALQPEFQRFLEQLWPDARARGVSAETFNQAFAGVTPDPKIVALSQKQSEFVRLIWDYLAGAVAPARVV